jgi:hypothetical protein
VKLDATPDTIRAVAQVFKLAAILDDRLAQADRNRVAAWAEQVHRHNLAEPDLLDGLQAFYDGPSERPIGVGDLIHHARIAKRDRLEREPDEMREARQVQLDARIADQIAEITAGKTVPEFTRPSARHGANPLSVRCPWCNAGVGQHCAVPQTSHRPAGGAHPSRIEAAQRIRANA